MTNYAYTVLNKAGEKLTGTIESEDMGKARENLNKLGFSVIAIDKAEEAKSQGADVKPYEFEAIDSNGKKVEGTIKAKEKIDAYKKLKKEYNLEIRYIVDSDLDPGQKAKEKIKGITDLELELRKEEKSQQRETEGMGEDGLLQSKINEEDQLKKKVEFVIQRIGQFTQEYKNVINPQKFAEIQKEKDKLLRIKNSKNMEYIKDVAESLLRMLQQEELFMQGKITEDKRAHLQIEAKKIMEELSIHEVKQVSKYEIVNKLKEWDAEHFQDRDDLKIHEKIIRELVQFMIRLFEEDPRVIELKKKLSTLNGQIIEYIKLYIKEKSKEGKKDIKQSISLISKERSKVKAELAGLKNRLSIQRKTDNKAKFRDDLETRHTFAENLISFSGWLLCFYILYYFASIYVTTKDFGLNNIPQGFYIYKSVSFKYIIVIVFLLHSAFSLKHKLFRNSLLATIIIFPIFTLAGVLILFNL